MAFGKVGSQRNVRQGKGMGKVPEDKKVCNGLSVHLDLIRLVVLAYVFSRFSRLSSIIIISLILRHDISYILKFKITLKEK